MDPLASLFDRYRRHGDLAALGQVFDALAPRLMAVALHVCGNAADAEDVLQETFVLAMDRGATFDASRRLEPWLAGLLQNVARNALRHAARRRAERLPELAHDGAGPMAAVERAELLALLRTHVDALPPEQRQVLRLQLQHGLSPAEIAVVLEVPPGTVRMRIHRGLEGLRKLLPAGLAIAASAAFAGRGLAAVKQSVLHAGRLHAAAAGVTSVAVVGGVVTMKKLAVVFGVALVLALSVWAWSNDGWPAVTPAAPRSADAAPLAAGDLQSSARASEGTASPVGDRSAAPASVGALRVRVTARAAASPGEAMAVPCTGVLLQVWAGESPLAPFSGDVRRVATDGAGEVLLAPLAPGPWQVHVVAERNAAPHAVMVVGGEETLLPIVRAAGHLARGTVVDANGAPVAGAEVWIHRGTYMGRYSMPERGELEARCGAITGDDGRFAVPIFDHEARLGACHPRYAESFAAFCSGDAGELRLVLGSAFAAAGGTVRDPNGRPVADALVQLTPAGRDSRRTVDGAQLGPRVDRLTRSDAQGRFRFEGVAAGRVRLAASAWPLNPAWQEQDVAAFAPVEIDLVLKDGVSVIGTVRNPDGSPARTALYSTPSLETDGHYSHCDTREDGSYELRYQPRRRFFVIVGHFGNIAASREFAPAETGVVRCDFVLADRRSVNGRVIADDGRPLPRWNVVAASESGHRTFARTDASGSFRTGVVHGATVTMRAFPPDGRESEPAIEQAVVLAEGQTIELRVPAAALPSASMRGWLVDPTGADVTAWRVTLHDANDQEQGGGPLRIAPDGTFQASGLSAGAFSLVARGAASPARRIASFELAAGEQRDVGQLVLEPFATVRVEFAHADGSPWRGPLPYAHLTDAAGHGVDAGTERRADCVRLRAVPGTYQVHVQGVDLIAAPKPVELAAGAESTVRLEVGIGRSRKLVWNGDGAEKPKPGDVLRVTVRAAGGAIVVQQDVTQLYPDLRGFRYWYLDRVFAFGSYEVEAHNDAGHRFRGSFEVRDNVEDPTRVDVPRAAR